LIRHLREAKAFDPFQFQGLTTDLDRFSSRPIKFLVKTNASFAADSRRFPLIIIRTIFTVKPQSRKAETNINGEVESGRG
ncbi:MAG: hypothetical protein C0623_03025, partial [Desulfuromonas sp.]